MRLWELARRGRQNQGLEEVPGQSRAQLQSGGGISPSLGHWVLSLKAFN